MASVLAPTTISTQLDQIKLLAEENDVRFLLHQHIAFLKLPVSDQGRKALHKLAHFLCTVDAKTLGVDGCHLAYQHLFFPPNDLPLDDEPLKQLIISGLAIHWHQDRAHFWQELAFDRSSLKVAQEAYLQFLIDRNSASNELAFAWKVLFERAIKANCAVQFIQTECAKCVNDDLLDLLVTTCKSEVVQEILLRYEQLLSLPHEVRGFTKQEALFLAVFIETRMKRRLHKGETYFKKEEYKIARTVVCDNAGLANLCSKSKVPLLEKVTGEYKKYRSAIQLSYFPALPAKLVAHSVSKGKEDYAASVHEMAIATLLRGKPCIAQLLGHQTHYKNDIPKLDLFWEYCEGNLWAVRTQKLLLSETTRMHLAHDIITGLYEMHKMNIIHGDLKLDNILYHRSKSRFFALLTDFGFSFVVGRQTPPFILSQGFYGSIWFTAPEIFGNRKFTGDYFLVEAFALGVVLYQLFFLEELPWIQFLVECYKQNEEITEDQQKQFQEMVAELVETRYAEFQKNPHVSQRGRFHIMLLKLLRPDPTKRIRVEQALQEIQLIFSHH